MLEEAAIEASSGLKKSISVAPREPDSDDIAAATLNEVKPAENPAAATRKSPKRTGYHVCGSIGENAAENRSNGSATEAVNCTDARRTRVRCTRIVLTAGRKPS